uniref:Uncharacterized protein n=1 Tax=Siphoviridae sp. ctNDP2 TaxID=2826265 RepID=A0A8S5NEG4_9CAUD|nr:MAG TPA: hypothetical protein [Siphoviridae sp. ctNDP2]
MKDQQMNNIGTQEEVNNATPWEENAQQDGNNMPSPGKNESVGTNGKPLTTEGFHTLLAANTFMLSKARREYATEIADLQKEYDDTLDIILEKEHQANFELREVRDEYEKAKEEHEQTLRELKKERNEAGRKQNVGKAEAKNRWSSANEEIQSKRHNIFEWYRNSGGGTHGSRGRTPSSRLDQRQEGRNER